MSLKSKFHCQKKQYQGLDKVHRFDKEDDFKKLTDKNKKDVKFKQ